ncbi:MAG: hypothetical protein O2968_11825 [Acidobacteria bacterium]|nr:hypothetical protein [Acidobacteriota bacterium]
MILYRHFAICLLAGCTLALAEDPAALQQAQRAKLGNVRTVYVDELNGSDGSAQIRDMLIGTLHRSAVFVITEDAEHADAFLRGSAEDLVFFESSSGREGLNVRGAVSKSSREAGESNFDSSSFGIGDTVATSRREQKHEAMAAVRLVLRDGEVIWSTTQESSGAKYRGPASDVAEKVTQQLVSAVQSARNAGAIQN